MPPRVPDWVSRLSGMAVGETIRIFTSLKHNGTRLHVNRVQKATGWRFYVAAHKDGDGYLITRKG